jgi:hypothetical protein
MPGDQGRHGYAAGRAGPMAATPTLADTSGMSRPALVGRTSAVAALDRPWGGGRGPSGLYMTGEAGIGKTRETHGTARCPAWLLVLWDN